MQTRGTVEGLYIPFLLNTFYKIEINQMKKKKFKSNTIDNEMSLTTFSVILAYHQKQ